MAQVEAKAVQIVSAPRVQGARARIEGSRICVVDVAQAHNSGKTPKEIRVRYPDLSLAQIHAALSYYYANREALEAELAEDLGWEEDHAQRRAEHDGRYSTE